MTEMVALTRVSDDDLADQDRADRAIAMMVAAQHKIADASTEELIEMRIWASAAAALAGAKRAHAVALEAQATQILAERKLGFLLRKIHGKFPPEFQHIPSGSLLMFKKLSRIPDPLFADAYAHGRSGQSLSASWIYQTARVISLKPAGPGISMAFDGSCLVKCGDNFKWRQTLTAAQDLLSEITGLRRDWATSGTRRSIDDMYATARKLAQAIDIVGRTASAEVKAHLAEAELLQAKVAEALSAAHTSAFLQESTGAT